MSRQSPSPEGREGRSCRRSSWWFLGSELRSQPNPTRHCSGDHRRGQVARLSQTSDGRSGGQRTNRSYTTSWDTTYFCPTCGSGVAVGGDVMPNNIVIQAGSLDDPTFYAPAGEIYLPSAMSWVRAQGGFPHTRA